MMEGQNIAIFNDQPLDSFHDIIVSFDYAFYNELLPPTGGFAVVFFDSINSMPREGGPDYSLGYTPSSKTEKCRLRGSRGLRSAFLGVGFDPYGNFSLKTDTVDGLSSSYINSVGIRLGKKDNYRLYDNTFDLRSYNSILSSFEIGDLISSNEEILYKSVRIILSNASTRLRVQLKPNANYEEYITVKDIELPSQVQSALKVALTNTTIDPTTKFKIKNFNVSGSTTKKSDRQLSECYQNLTVGKLMTIDYNAIISSGSEWLATSTGTDLSIFTTDSLNYDFDQTVYSSLPIKIIGDDGINIVTTTQNSSSVQIHKYLGSKFKKTADILLPSGLVSCADIDKNTLVAVGSAPNGRNNIYIYKYINTLNNLSAYGTWELFQTFNYTQIVSGRYCGVSCQIEGDNFLIGNSNEYVHAFRFKPDKGWTFLQNIYFPLTGKSEFGYTMSLQGNDLIIGAPIARKEKFPVYGGGEVFHYYNASGNDWVQVMQIGSFYNLDVAAGGFGSSVKYRGDVLLVGTPYQLWEPQNPLDPLTYNVGRVFVFRKTPGGIFSQGTVLIPLTAQLRNNLQFGKGVTLFNNTAAVAAPNYEDLNNSFISFYNIDCIFNFKYPAPIAIPANALITVDLTAFILSYQEGTYMVSINQ